ncbi:MAG: tripartite tricarboxylate transporter substrate binding protein [Rhizobiales bacterium]|nr:tripartite tricarboxylate transporter substrate binding protein [Hyphomicrobiales bacterium]
MPIKTIERLSHRALSRRAVCLGFGAATLSAAAGRASTGEWPSRPVTVVVPYAAGGNTDMMARLSSQYLANKLGQPFVIENRAGGGGAIGAIAVSKARPDGYTLLFGASTQLVNIPMLQKVVYSHKDFTPISIFGAGPYLLGIKSSLPVKTLDEFIAYVKARPGELNYGTAGVGGNVHLNTALFLSRAGLTMTAIPYRSGAPAMAGLVAGEVEMYFGNASELMLHTETKSVRILAISTQQRIAQLPNVPTVAETFPGFDTSSWNGFLAPAGTPKPIVETIEKLVVAAAKEPAIVERLNQLAILPFGTTKEEFEKAIEKSRVINRESMKAAALPLIE